MDEESDKSIEEEEKVPAEEAPAEESGIDDTQMISSNDKIVELEEAVPTHVSQYGATTDSSKDSKKPMKLGELLVEKGLVSKDQVEIALREQREREGEHMMLGAVMVSLGFITDSALGEVLSETSGIKNVDLHSSALDPNVISKVPKEIAMRHKAIPMSERDEEVTVAMSDVYNIIALDDIRKFFPRHYKIMPAYAPEAEILEVIDQYYQYEMSIDGILREIETGISEKKRLSGEEGGYINPTVRLVDAFLVDAVKIGASDLHFEPDESFVRVRYRIDGKLRQVRSFHKEYWAAIAVRVKIISNMNIAESRHPQDGRINLNVLGREVDFRVATHPTIFGENIVMRVLDKKSSLVPLDKLGITEENEALIKKLLKRPEGIVIVTGPTGSGKTTTLYSVLNYINTIEKNIMTLEDPVEYQLPLIRQANVRADAGMSFTDGIKSMMRQDPDIIFIGEVRDNVTANMALRAAMTGHQVYTTLHTNDAIGAIPRLIDIGVPNTILPGALICIVAQRLARRLCGECKKEKVADAEECHILNVPADNPPTIYDSVGCEVCEFKGFKGRVGLNEVLAVDKGLDELIAKDATRNEMLNYAMEKGFVPMIDDGCTKVMRGITSLKELINTIDMTSRL